MFIREFECKKCGKIQEKWLDNRESENTESCEECGAGPEDLDPALSSTPKHGSWGRWSV